MEKITPQKIRRALTYNRDDDAKSFTTTKVKKIIEEENTDIISLFKNSLFFPDREELHNQVAFIRGGIRFGGRYPDIIISIYDYERAQNLLETLRLDTNVFNYSLKIVRWVQKVLHTKDFVKYTIVDGTPVPARQWAQTFETAISCISKIIPRPNSFTNITGIPYMFGDCREHGILTSFLCKVYSELIGDTREFRVLYTKSFIIFEEELRIKQLGEHVFVIFKDRGKLYVVDSLFESEDRQLSRNQNLHEVDFIDKDEYSTFTMPSDFENTNKPIIHSGNFYINGTKHKLFSIPMIWENEIEIIDNSFFSKLSYEDIILYNRLFKFDEYDDLWQSHREWCSDISLGKTKNKHKQSNQYKRKSKRKSKRKGKRKNK